MRPETRKIAENAHAALVDTIDRRFRKGHGREALDEDKLLAPCVEHLFGGETIVEGLQAGEIERMDEKKSNYFGDFFFLATFQMSQAFVFTKVSHSRVNTLLRRTVTFLRVNTIRY